MLIGMLMMLFFRGHVPLPILYMGRYRVLVAIDTAGCLLERGTARRLVVSRVISSHLLRDYQQNTQYDCAVQLCAVSTLTRTRRSHIDEAQPVRGGAAR